MANITITAANVVPPTSGTSYLPGKLAGESVSAGDWLYIKASDGKAWKASAASAAEATVVGMAATTSATGQPVSIMQKVTDLPIGSVVGSGKLYFISTTAGKMWEESDQASSTGLYPSWLCQSNIGSTAITFDFTNTRIPILKA